MIKNFLLQALTRRLLVYRKFMTCKPRLDIQNNNHQYKYSFKLNEIPTPTLLMSSGFWYEKHISWLAYLKPKKHVYVPDMERIIQILHLSPIVVTIPCSEYASYFDCDVKDNIVYEIWAPRFSPILLESATRGKLVYFVPDNIYIKSFSEIVNVIKNAVQGSEEAYVYALSKFSYPGVLGKFLEAFNGISSTSVVIATSASKKLKENIENSYRNVLVVDSRSHRKALLILAKLSSNEWEVLGFHGSMNLFAPGVDDYLVYANDFSDLTIVVHSILRALLAI